MMDELQDGQEQLKLAESRLACMVEAGGGLAKILGPAIHVGYSRPVWSRGGQAEKPAQGCAAALGQDQAGAEVLQQPAQ